MLAPKQVQPTQIISFRLVSGEEIVGRLVSDDSNVIVVSKPISIGIQMVGKGQASIAFMPFMASVDDSGTISFPKTALVTSPTGTRKDVEASYIQATSGLTIPTSGGPSSLITP